jgi:hypothetical protein
MTRYPSLLESSDIDGGSSVAVLTYLRRILESVDHPDMINLILHYLLALPQSSISAPFAPQSKVSKARKRKSMDLATMMAAKVDITTATPLLFNLVDLLLACLRSHSQQTIHVTLQLVSAVVRRHHRYAVVTLIQTEHVPDSSTHRTVGAHQQEVEYFMSLAGMVGGQDNFDEIYDGILKDTVVRLEAHPCSIAMVAPRFSANNHKLPAIPDSLPDAPRDVRSHTIRVTDPLLNTVLDRLETFFLNPVDTNLSLTETLVDLATCGYMNIEGWLSRHPDNYVYEEVEQTGPSEPPASLDPDSAEYLEFQTVQAMKKCKLRPKWSASSLPRLLSCLQGLSDQVVAYRESIPRFDDLLQQRREAFQTADSVTPNPEPMTRSRRPQGPPPTSTPAVDRSSMDDSRAESPGRPSGIESFAQRLLNELSTPMRSGSPRGRKEPAVGTPSRPTLSGGYGLATPTNSKPLPPPPRDYPVPPYDTPSRVSAGQARSYSPESQRGDPSSWEGRDPLVASQIAAFQAVDQKILARRVGLPRSSKVQPVPLDFDKTSEVNDDEVDGSDASVVDTARNEAEAEETTVTVSHVITNAVVLQSFLMELAALVQARAGLFDEVRFT